MSRTQFIQRGDYDLHIHPDEFASYSGFPAEESRLYLHAAIQLVESTVCRSFADHVVHHSLQENVCTSLLPYGPVVEIMEINKNDSCGNSTEVNLGYCRTISDKIYLPNYECSWEILYRTRAMEIGPLDRIVVFKVADCFANGDKIECDHVRKLLHEHKPHANHLTTTV